MEEKREGLNIWKVRHNRKKGRCTLLGRYVAVLGGKHDDEVASKLCRHLLLLLHMQDTTTSSRHPCSKAGGQGRISEVPRSG